MERIFFIIALFICAAHAAAQDPTIDKGSGNLYFSGKPGITPNTTYGSEYAIDLSALKAYMWNRDSSAWYPYPDISHSFSVPSGDPGTDSKLHINRSTGRIYRWNGSIWDEIKSGATSLSPLSYVDANIDSAILKNGADVFDINVSATSAAVSDYKIQLPNVAGVDSAIVVLRPQKSELSNYDYYIEPFDSLQLKLNGKRIKRYYLDNNEVVTIESKNNEWRIQQNRQIFRSISRNKRYAIGDKIGAYHVEGAKLKDGSEFTLGVITDENFVIPVLPKTTTYKNYVRGSENMSTLGGTNVWAAVPELSVVQTVDAELAPDGYKTAEKWQFTASSGKIRINRLNTFSISPGDTVTISGWIKPGIESYNDNITLSISDITGIFIPGSASISSFNAAIKDWQYFEQSFIFVSGSDYRFDLNFTCDSLDYVYVSKFAYNIGGGSAEYISTPPTLDDNEVDTIYAVYRPTDGVLKMDDVQWLQTSDYGANLTAASQFCANSGLCNTIQLTSNITTSTEAVISSGVGIDLNGYTITWEGADTSKSVIYFANTTGFAYSEKQWIKNGVISGQGAAEAAIKDEETYKLDISNIIIEGNNNILVGIKLGEENADFASLIPSIRQVEVTSCINTCIENNYANRVSITDPSLLGCDYGYKDTRGSVKIEFGNIEDCDTSAVYFDGNMIEMNSVYFESTPNVPGSDVVNINGARSVHLNSLYFLSPDSIPRSHLRLNNVSAATIINPYFAGVTGLPIQITCNTLDWEIVLPSLQSAWTKSFLSNGHGVCYENGSVIINDDYGRKINVINSSLSKLDSAIIENAKIGGDLSINQLTLRSEVNNLFSYSDSIYNGTAGSLVFVENYDLKFGGTAGVSSDSTGTLITATVNQSGSESVSTMPLREPLVAGQDYCISFYVKDISESQGYVDIIFRTDGTDQSIVNIFPNGESTYKRYQAHFVPANAVSSLTIRTQSWEAGDSIVVSNFQINKGRLPTKYQETRGLGAKDTLQITVNSTDTLIVNGSIQIEKLHDTSGDVGTSGQALTSTGTGTDWKTLFTSGSATGTTDLNGDVIVTHGLGSTPSAVLVTGDDGNPRIYHVTSKGATTFGVNVNDATGADVTSGAYAFDWIAIK